MARPAPKISKPLAKAMFQHRVDAAKHPASTIIEKFALGTYGNFYRAYYHATQQQA